MRYKNTGIDLEEYKKILDRKSYERLRLPLPSNDRELEILSEYIFDAQLHLLKLDCYGDSASYEVKESHNSYYDGKFNQAAHNSCYEVDAFFWRTVIGSLYCGGIARASYGQVDIKGHRNQKRIEKWVNSRRNKDGSSIRKPFIRLAAQIRERREQNDSR